MSAELHLPLLKHFYPKIFTTYNLHTCDFYSCIESHSKASHHEISYSQRDQEIIVDVAEFVVAEYTDHNQQVTENS